MSAYECAVKMSKDEVLDKIAALNLPDYGLSGNTLTERIGLAKTECIEDGKESGVVAALNNADVDGALLEVLKEEPEKIMEGIAVAAYATDTERKMLFIPAYAADLAEREDIKNTAEKYQIEIIVDLLDVRKYKGCTVMHIVTAKNLADAIEGTYTPGVYVSVNGGKTEKQPCETKLAELVNSEGVKAVQAGYRYLRPEALDLTVGEAEIKNGILRTLTASDCIVAETEKRLTACRKQSCGKCVFCREGLLQLQYMQKEITEGRGKMDFFDLTKEIGETMAFSTCCSMGEVSGQSALTAMELFPTEYEAHIKKKKCPAEICFSSEVIYIDPKTCTGCGECMDVCPKDCIEGKTNYIHMIDDMECDKCGKCMEVCEAGAIVKTSGKLPKLPNRLTKVGRFKKR